MEDDGPALTATDLAALRASLGGRERPRDVAATASLTLGREVTEADVLAALDRLVALGLAGTEDGDARGAPRFHATYRGVDACAAFGRATDRHAADWSEDRIASAAFRAARLGAALDHDGVRQVLVAAGAPDERVDAAARLRDAKVTAAAEAFLRVAARRPLEVFDALVDRPRPGAKAVADAAMRTMLAHLAELRRVVEGTRPLRLVASGEEATLTATPSETTP